MCVCAFMAERSTVLEKVSICALLSTQLCWKGVCVCVLAPAPCPSARSFSCWGEGVCFQAHVKRSIVLGRVYLKAWRSPVRFGRVSGAVKCTFEHMSECVCI